MKKKGFLIALFLVVVLVCTGWTTGRWKALWWLDNDVVTTDKDVKTTGSVSAANMEINQAADGVGVQINGYDDKSTSYLDLYIPANGDPEINAVTTGSFLIKKSGSIKILFGGSSISVYENFYPNITTTYSLGTTTKRWSSFYSAGIIDDGTDISIAHDCDVVGELTAGTKTFLIDHPLQPLTKNLVHMSIEGPRVDLIYRGTAMLKDGKATVNLDTDSTVHPMIAGTFDALTQNAICTSLQNQTSFNRLKPSQITAGKFTIECESATATDVVAWVVMAERRDPFIKSCSTTDENGRLIPEHDKEAPAADALDARTEIVTDMADLLPTTEIVQVAGKAGYPRHYKAYGVELPTRQVLKVLESDQDIKKQ